MSVGEYYHCYSPATLKLLELIELYLKKTVNFCTGKRKLADSSELSNISYGSAYHFGTATTRRRSRSREDDANHLCIQTYTTAYGGVRLSEGLHSSQSR